VFALTPGIVLDKELGVDGFGFGKWKAIDSLTHTDLLRTSPTAGRSRPMPWAPAMPRLVGY
jgi:hypothetical protein